MAEKYSASDKEAIEKRTTKIRSEEERQVLELGRLLNMYEGRAYIWRIMSECGIFSNSYAGDVNDTLFNEGRRKIGLVMLTEVLTHFPKAFTLMQTEATQRNKERED